MKKHNILDDMRKIILTASLLVLVLGTMVTVFPGCDGGETITDIQQTAALRKVVFTYDSMQLIVGLPEGALDGEQSFAELFMADSAKYKNPANYSVSLIAAMSADNTVEDARDAKFDGMVVDVIFDTIASNPVQMEADPFTVAKGVILAVGADGGLNLATHRRAGLYIFRQIVDGNDLATTLKPTAFYKFGQTEGSIDLAEMKKNIPTRASPELKAFLSGLLESGILDEE